MNQQQQQWSKLSSQTLKTETLFKAQPSNNGELGKTHEQKLIINQKSCKLCDFSFQ
jgi:hypothetical protein